ncbi:MAG TPA: hypothetical protein VLA29_04820 [Acidimicrobiia bacterium]|nr:hypothetical protein [Acidimicrobiia bacterium]
MDVSVRRRSTGPAIDATVESVGDPRLISIEAPWLLYGPEE